MFARPATAAVFLSTPSARRATGHLVESLTARIDFYPRPPRGGRPRKCNYAIFTAYFYPRPPRGGRRWFVLFQLDADGISIHALREEGDDAATLTLRARVAISIHALREEGDLRYFVAGEYGEHFYPRPPRGGRQRAIEANRLKYEFLSTPSARRATVRCCCAAAAAQISIHALREEGDG